MLGMPDTLRHKVVDALLEYVNNGSLPTDTEVLYSAFLIMQKQIDRDAEKYKEKCAKRSAAGKLGNKARWGEKSQTIANVANIANATFASQKSQTIANIADNDNENDNENGNEKEDILPTGNTKVITDNISSKEKKQKKEKSEKFVPPTVEQVQAYISEKGYNVDAQYFVDYYQSKGWVVGKSPMKDWKAAVRLWNSKNLKNGLNPDNNTSLASNHRAPAHANSRRQTSSTRRDSAGKLVDRSEELFFRACSGEFGDDFQSLLAAAAENC